MSATQPATRQKELAALKETKQRLALDALGGNEKARSEFKATAKQISQIESEIELEELAAAERSRRDAEIVQAAEASARLAKEESLAVLRAEGKEKWDAFQAAVDGILAPLSEAYEAERAVYGAASELGLNPRWNIADRLTSYISSTLGPRLNWRGFDYISPRYREGALVEDVELSRCSLCGGEYPENAQHNCSMKKCDRCKQVIAKTAKHSCLGG